MIVYKVVRQLYEGMLVSCTGDYHFGQREQMVLDDWTLMYNTSSYTYPRIGKLFAFDSLQNAESFVNNGFIDDTQIWEASTTRAEPSVYAAAFSSDIFRFWERQEKNIANTVTPYLSLLNAPRGTLFCDDIILLRRLV